MNLKRLLACGIPLVLVLGILAIILLRSTSSPIITTPYTVMPITRYGIDVPPAGLFARYNGGQRQEDRIYILGVFKGGDVVDGEEVTHMINADELIELLFQTNIGPRPRGEYIGSTWAWSIYLHQNGDMSITLGGDGNNIIARNVRGWFGNEPQAFTFTGGDAVEATLERMVAEYVS